MHGLFRIILTAEPLGLPSAVVPKGPGLRVSRLAGKKMLMARMR